MPTDAELERAATRRSRVYDLIATSISERGYPPAISELARQTGVSTRTTRTDLAALVDAGRIERDAGEHRGIRLVANV